MQFVNKSKNTIYLEDIGLSIPYKEDMDRQSISLEQAKKSPSFRKLVKSGVIELKSTGNSVLEKNLLQAQSKASDFSDTRPDTDEVSGRPRSSVKIKGHFFEAGGYAKANRNMALGLRDLGVDVSIEPVNSTKNSLKESELKELGKLKKKARADVEIHSMVPTVAHMHSTAKYKVLATTIESATIPDQFVETANQYNEVWVTSDFCKDVLLKSNVQRPVHVFPNSFDLSLYNDNVEPYQFSPSPKGFVFLSVFGWGYRKGYDALLRSYLEEFSGDDDVTLLLISRARNDDSVIKKTVDDYINRFGGDNAAHIARCSKVIPEQQMPQIYKACDSFVLFSRGEGFGNPYVEAALCGLPITATNCSGHTMFLKEDNSNLVDIDYYEKVPEGVMKIHYWDNQEFPSLKTDDFISRARKSMRSVYEDYDYYLSKNKKLQKELVENYSIESVCSKIAKRLDEIRSS